jgi:hypothetical protein
MLSRTSSNWLLLSSLVGQLFGGAYPSVHHLIYQNCKPQQNGLENGKDDQYGPVQKGGQNVRLKGGHVNGSSGGGEQRPHVKKSLGDAASPGKPPVLPSRIDDFNKHS